jgi:hypothetical protein
VDSITKYPWSSYSEYFGKNGICDIKFALSLFSGDEKRAKESFEKFNVEENDDKCLDCEERIRIDDREATKIILEVAGAENTRLVQSYEKERRDIVIKALKIKGLSIRQIERLTGLSFVVIRKI